MSNVVHLNILGWGIILEEALFILLLTYVSGLLVNEQAGILLQQLR